MSNKIKGAFTVRFIRTGDQIYVTKNIVKFDKNGAESGGSLFQAIDPTSGTLSVCRVSVVAWVKSCEVSVRCHQDCTNLGEPNLEHEAVSSCLAICRSLA